MEMNWTKRNIQYIISFYLLIFILSVLGCVETLQSAKRRSSHRPLYEKQHLRTYKRPEVKPQASEDGLKFNSEHYTLTFSEDITKESGYESADERKSRGVGDMMFLERQYDFVRKIFGFEAKDKIKIVVQPILGKDAPYERDAHHAYTSVRRGVEQVDNQFRFAYDIIVYFGIEAFKSRSIQAHELTHAFTQVYALPTWLAEGIAVLVEAEYAGGARWAKRHKNLERFRLDENGVNIIQNWQGHGSNWSYKRTVEAYAYAYSLISELRERYGEDYFKKFFALIEEDGIHHKAGTLGTSVVVYYMSQAAGEDLVPFFEQLKFKVHKLTREDIFGILTG